MYDRLKFVTHEGLRKNKPSHQQLHSESLYDSIERMCVRQSRRCGREEQTQRSKVVRENEGPAVACRAEFLCDRADLHVPFESHPPEGIADIDEIEIERRDTAGRPSDLLNERGLRCFGSVPGQNFAGPMLIGSKAISGQSVANAQSIGSISRSRG
ncbi:MAG TPA: hypothetical protein VNN08_19260 [Thermoanaerobaculia bacterium]|nr:hypothetical protein [Thermoanaerobaculia bacterium]